MLKKSANKAVKPKKAAYKGKTLWIKSQKQTRVVPQTVYEQDDYVPAVQRPQQRQLQSSQEDADGLDEYVSITQEAAPRAHRKAAEAQSESDAEYESRLDKQLNSRVIRRNQSSYQVKSRRREIGGHLFPTTILFPSPIPRARFGFSQGVLITKGSYVEISDDNGDGATQQDEIYANKYSKYGFSEVFDSGMVFANFAALDLNARIELSGGMDNKDFVTVEASPQGDVRVGPVFYYKKEESKLLLSFSPRLYYSKGITVSASYGLSGTLDVMYEKIGGDPGFWDFLSDTQEMGGDGGQLDTIDELFELVSSTYVSSNIPAITKGFTKNLVVSKTKLALSPSIGVAYPITNYLGAQGFIEYQKIKEKSETGGGMLADESYSQMNYGAAISVDCRHWISFPVGMALELAREKNKWQTQDSLGLGTYYQGIGDIQLGLFFRTSKTDYEEEGYAASYGQKLWMFNMTYFF